MSGWVLNTIRILMPFFGVWLRTNFMLHISFFSFCSTSGQANKKAWVLPPLVIVRGNSNFASLCLHVGTLIQAPLPNHNKNPKSNSFSCSLKLFSDQLGKSVLPFPKSLITWVINIFLSSWYVCGIICLDIWTKLWLRVHFLFRLATLKRVPLQP